MIITPPDDTLIQGLRIVHVNLVEQQSHVVSQALLQWKQPGNIINYVWNHTQSLEWLLNAVTKSDLVLFNADYDQTEMINGYLAADPRSNYFGYLRDLHLVNERVIYNSDDVLTLIEAAAKHNGKI